MKKIVLFLFALSLIVIACETMDEQETFTQDKKSLDMITETEIVLLQYKISKSYDDIIKAKGLINQLEKLARNNKRFEAKVFGLQGEAALLQHNIPLVNECISYIEARNLNEEKLFVLRAEMERNPEKQMEILLNGIKKADSTDYLKLMLAEHYFRETKFKKAVNLYDEVFTLLAPVFKETYNKHRELSYRFIKSPPKNKSITTVLLKSEITYEDMIKILFTETNLLTSIVKAKQYEDIYGELLKKNYIHYDVDAHIKDTVKRKDIAYILIHILSTVEKDPSLIGRFKSRDDYLNKESGVEESPIPDVESSVYYYNAVLRLIERELMDLPNGENFFPDAGMDGIRFYEIANKMVLP